MGKAWEALVTAWSKVRGLWCGRQIYFRPWGFLKAVIFHFCAELGWLTMYSAKPPLFVTSQRAQEHRDDRLFQGEFAPDFTRREWGM